MKELTISLPARRVDHKTLEVAGRYRSCASKMGFEFFCLLIASNTYGEIYPLWVILLGCRMVSSYSCKAKVIKTICGINSVKELSSQTER
jgi:hypothetical protein